MKHGAKVKLCRNEDAQNLLKREECALGMDQKLNTNDAVLKDAHVSLSREECVLSMEQRSDTNDAALKDAQILLRREEYVLDTVHIANTMMNLLLSHRVLDQNLIILL